MKKRILILTLSYFLVGCGGGSTEKTETTNANEETKEASAPVDLCRCLTEPGNTEWSAENQDACRDAISKELGVENWEKVNFSQNRELSKKFDELAERCTGTKEVKTGIEEIDNNSSIVKEIGTSAGYVWESINEDAQIYTTLAFDGLAFRTTAYSMNGQTNSENFTKAIALSGTWQATSETSAEGVMSPNNVRVSWDFSDDYTSLTNSKGVVFKRVKIR